MLEGQFEKCYRMSSVLSEKLVGTLAPDLSNRKISGNLVQMVMHAGGSSHWNYSLVSSLCMNCRSKCGFILLGVHIVLDCIVSNGTIHFSMKLFRSVNKICKAVTAHKKHSTNKLLKECVVTFSGWLALLY